MSDPTLSAYDPTTRERIKNYLLDHAPTEYARRLARDVPTALPVIGYQDAWRLARAGQYAPAALEAIGATPGLPGPVFSALRTAKGVVAPEARQAQRMIGQEQRLALPPPRPRPDVNTHAADDLGRFEGEGGMSADGVAAWRAEHARRQALEADDISRFEGEGGPPARDPRFRNDVNTGAYDDAGRAADDGMGMANPGPRYKYGLPAMAQTRDVTGFQPPATGMQPFQPPATGMRPFNPQQRAIDTARSVTMDMDPRMARLFGGVDPALAGEQSAVNATGPWFTAGTPNYPPMRGASQLPMLARGVGAAGLGGGLFALSGDSGPVSQPQVSVPAEPFQQPAQSTPFAKVPDVLAPMAHGAAPAHASAAPQRDIPMPPRRPADLAPSAPMDRGDYQSNARQVLNADRSVNWGDQDLASDFFRADKMARQQGLYADGGAVAHALNIIAAMRRHG